MPGYMEEAVLNDISQLPVKMRSGGVAAGALHSARILDLGGLAPRDEVTYVREIRLALAQLREMAPGDVKGDATDEVAMRREKRLAAEAG